LAEAFHKNTEPKTFCDSVPTHLHNFEDVFAKSSFDALPNHKPWDHAIELILDAKPVNCKVYPLAPKEQKESINSSSKTFRQVAFALPNHQWHCQSSSLRRRMVAYASSKTIVPSMQ